MSDITLSAGIRANLLSLQQTADLMSTTHNRLATGKRPTPRSTIRFIYFQSSAPSARANDLSGLLRHDGERHFLDHSGRQQWHHRDHVCGGQQLKA